jgi:hypothetical protein
LPIDFVDLEKVMISKPIDLFNLEKALSSICNTPLVGSLYKDKIDFRWPLEEDIR